MTLPENSFTDDRLLGGRVQIRQPVSGYRVAVDPVLLAAAVPAKSGQNILDAGCGTGAALFCLAARVSGLDLTGLERQALFAAYAQAGVTLNGLASCARILTGDLAQRATGPFDIVMTNPPFADSGTPPPDGSRAAAHMESDIGLHGWIGHCLAVLRPKGRLVVIHRADRLSDILSALAERAGDIHIRPIYGKAGQPARRVIVDAGKGRRTPDTLLPGLVLHTDDGAYTPAADAVLRGGEPLL